MDAEDIDDLLDEVEKDLNKPKKTREKEANGRSEQTSKMSTTEDLDFLLTDLPHHDVDDADSAKNSSAAVAQDKKCWPPYLTGPCDSASVRPCPHLRCVKCDSAVVNFDGWEWSGDVTYLFLRTHYPNVDSLRAKLLPSRTRRAYACQCTSTATSLPVALTPGQDNPWVCTGKTS